MHSPLYGQNYALIREFPFPQNTPFGAWSTFTAFVVRLKLDKRAWVKFEGREGKEGMGEKKALVVWGVHIACPAATLWKIGFLNVSNRKQAFF